MSKKLYEESNIQAIAAAIREKNGTQNTYTAAQMANAVRAITTQPNLETLSVDQNGNYLPSAGKDGFSSVSVNVSGGAAVVQPLSATQNGTYNPPSGVDGYAPVTVNVSGGGGGGDIDPLIESILNASYVSFSQKSTSDLDNYVLGIDSVGFASGTRGGNAVPMGVEDCVFSDIMSILNSQYNLEYFTNVSTTNAASVLTSDILSKLNAVLLGNISGEGDLNDSIENYKRIFLFGSYSSSFEFSVFDVGISYPIITLGTPYITGVKDRNTSYRASVIFTSNNHVTAKGNVDGTGADRRVRIYGIP